MEKQKTLRKSIWALPNACFLLIAAVSLSNTAQGMNATFFKRDFLAGTAVALAIQFLLLWLNQMLPKMIFRKSKGTQIFIFSVYIFVALWSIGFSFIYVCNGAYDTVYMRDDQDQLADTYRKEKFQLEQRANLDFTEKLQEATSLIGQLQAMAADIDSATSATAVQSAIPDFQKLKTYFSGNAEMTAVIQKCENATGSKVLGNPDELEAKVRAALTNAANEKAALQADHNALQSQIDIYNNRISDISVKMYPLSAKSKAFKSLESQLNLEIENRDTLAEEQADKKTEIVNKDAEIAALNSLNSYISAMSNMAGSKLSLNFSEILALLGSTDPDPNKANGLLDGICNDLMAAMQEDGKNLTYTEILEGNLKLQAVFRELSQIRAVQVYCSNESTNGTDICHTTEQWVSMFPTAKEKELWRNAWNEEIIALKTNIYMLPSSSDQNVINTYEKISVMQRNILTELGGLERAIYYLFGPHPTLAWICLLLAIVLDTLPMLFMMIKKLIIPVPQPVPQVIMAQ